MYNTMIRKIKTNKKNKNIYIYSHLNSLILSNPVQFSSRLLLWLATLAFTFHASHLVVLGRGLFLYFQIKCFSFWQKLFLLVFLLLIMSVMYIYQLITVQFVATLKCFYYFSVLSFELGSKPSFSIHISFFCSWIQLVVELTSAIDFPELKNLAFFHF